MADKIALVSDAVAKLAVDTDLPSNKCITITELNELTKGMLPSSVGAVFCATNIVNDITINGFSKIAESFGSMWYYPITSTSTIKCKDSSMFYYILISKSAAFSVPATRSHVSQLSVGIGGLYFISK